MLTLLALACNPPDDTTSKDTPPPTDGESTGDTAPTVTSTGDTSLPATGETGILTTPPDCTDLPDGTPPVPFTQMPIVTTEDFDFDALGYLVYSDWTNFTAVDSYGNFVVIAPGVFDTRGIQILDNGDIVAAYIGMGMVGYTDRLTGGSYSLITGLSGPNAMDIGDDNEIFVSETGGGPKVRSWDLDTLTVTNIADGFIYPNGIALNNEQDILYVADSTAGIYKVPKNGDGTWGPKQLLFNPPGSESYDGIEVDICGNVYTVQFYSGELHRFDPETLENVLLLDIEDPGSFLFNSIRWGANRGGWRRDVLYVTDRHRIFGVEVGVEGRRQPVDAMP
jgi:sugar lactone lactonase YvrE